MIRVLFAAGETEWTAYRPALETAFDEAGLSVELATAMEPDRVDYIVYAPDSAVTDFRPFRRLKAVLNLWAGVENVVGNETLRVPLCRMVEPGMTEDMAAYVAGQVLRHHLGLDAWLPGTPGLWVQTERPLPRDRKVGILGLGELGRACAVALAALGFDVAGWSRTPKEVPGIRCRSGPGGLSEVLGRSEILVLLVPLTPETGTLIDARALAAMPEGAVLINPGRGALIDDEALLAALDAGHLAHATLDVFREEPLPPDHPFWAHPGVTVTPHVAALTRVATASRVIAENLRRGEAGEALLHVVDRSAGY